MMYLSFEVDHIMMLKIISCEIEMLKMKGLGMRHLNEEVFTHYEFWESLQVG